MKHDYNHFQTHFTTIDGPYNMRMFKADHPKSGGSQLYINLGYRGKGGTCEPMIQEINGHGDTISDPFPVAINWFDTAETGRSIEWLEVHPTLGIEQEW